MALGQLTSIMILSNPGSEKDGGKQMKKHLKVHSALLQEQSSRNFVKKVRLLWMELKANLEGGRFGLDPY